MAGLRMKAAVSAIFVALLLLPALQMLTGAVKVTPLNENRTLAPLPPLSEVVHPSAFLGALHAWFNDHYGLRSLLIRSKTQADYALFGASDRLHIGQAGFLFYRSVIDQSEIGIEGLNDQDLGRAVSSFEKLRDWLAPRGIHLIVMTEQLKDKFYPDRLPREARFATRRHRFDDFRNMMRTVPGITYLDTTPMLEAVKQSRQIYHKTDFHWNDPAAFPAARWLVDTVAKAEGRPVPFWRHSLKITQHEFSGGQALFMPLFNPPEEIGLFVEPTWNSADIRWDAHVPPFEWRTFGSGQGGQAPLPGTVIFGDSFVGGMVRSGLPLYFASLSYARLYGVPLDTVLQNLPSGTKYFVVEFIEMSLPSFMNIALPR